MVLKHLIYGALALAGLIWCWANGIQWISEGGNILNLPSFFIDAYKSGSAAAFLTIDIAVVWASFMIWVVGDAVRVGLGARIGWIFIALSFLGTCFAFPLYLIARERRLASSRTAS